MFAYIMSLVIPAPRLNQWNNSYIQPGAVGMIGGVNLQPRLKTSTPDMPLRYDPTYSGPNLPYLGSNVQDGQVLSWQTGAGSARTEDAWTNPPPQFRNVGQIFQNVIPDDRMMEPIMDPVPMQRWNAVLGEVNKALTSGEEFLPFPNGYGYSKESGSIPRGGSYPTRIDMVGGITLPVSGTRVGKASLGTTRRMNKNLADDNFSRDERNRKNLAAKVNKTPDYIVEENPYDMLPPAFRAAAEREMQSRARQGDRRRDMENARSRASRQGLRGMNLSRGGNRDYDMRGEDMFGAAQPASEVTQSSAQGRQRTTESSLRSRARRAEVGRRRQGAPSDNASMRQAARSVADVSMGVRSVRRRRSLPDVSMAPRRR